MSDGSQILAPYIKVALDIIEAVLTFCDVSLLFYSILYIDVPVIVRCCYIASSSLGQTYAGVKFKFNCSVFNIGASEGQL